MPSVTYGLPLWGSCNKTHINNLEKLHTRAARIIHRLPWDANSEEVLALTKWDTTATMYKRRLAELVYKVVKNLLPDELTNLFRRKSSTYRLRRGQSLTQLRPETNVLRDSIAYRGALLRNTLPKHITTAEGIRTFKRILKKYDFKSFTFDKLVTKGYSCPFVSRMES